jgi:hypothetical protein
MKMYRACMIAMLAFVATGCATILNDNSQKVNITSSNGKPIEGTINGVPFKGPGIVEVSRSNQDKIIVTTTPGCAGSTVLAKSVDSKFFVNILSGGPYGSTTDYVSEKMWKYQDSVVIACQ